MHVILEARSDGGAPQRTALVVGQSLTIGRTEHADWAIPDQRISSVHFSVSVTCDACQVKDLNSSNGTFLNETRVAESLLNDGDQIRAGGTVFAVRIEDAPMRMRRQDSPESPPATRRAPQEATIPSSGGAVLGPTVVGVTLADRGANIEPFPPRPKAVPQTGSVPTACDIARREVCDSGLVAVRGSQKLPSAAGVARMLAGQCPLYVVADFRGLGRPLPEDAAGHEFLIDWVAEDAQKRYSPLFFGDPDVALRLIDECWGKDGLIAIFSKAEKPPLLAHLRVLAGAFARPGILTAQLVRALPAYAANVMAQIEGVLVEDAGPAGWVLLMRAESWLLASLGQFGFCEQPATGAVLVPNDTEGQRKNAK